MYCKKSVCLFAILFSWTIPFAQGKTLLQADGNSDNTYSHINSAFGGNIAYEVPDSSHPNFGPHILQTNDSTLNRPVFAFKIHVTPDDDRSDKGKDRQRVEIKVPPSPANSSLKGFEGDFVTFSWNFRLGSQFEVSSKFCAIHQLKASGGNIPSPLIHLNLMKSGDSKLFQVIYVGRHNRRRVLTEDSLSKFTGKWIHVLEEVSYSRNGTYNLVLTKVDNHDEHVLLTYENNNLDMWRDGAESVRPKWGIYRSLGGRGALRNETVYFDRFCLSKGTIDKCL